MTKSARVCDDDVGVEYSANHPVASLCSLCINSTPALLLPSISLLSALSLLFILVWQRNEDLDVVEREEPRLAVQHSLVPVLVDLIGQGDDIALAEAQLALVFWLKVVQRLTARLLRG